MQTKKYVHWSSIWTPRKRKDRKSKTNNNALDIQIKQKSINNEVILAKLQVNYPHVKQEESRNGKILKEIKKTVYIP